MNKVDEALNRFYGEGVYFQFLGGREGKPTWKTLPSEGFKERKAAVISDVADLSREDLVDFLGQLWHRVER